MKLSLVPAGKKNGNFAAAMNLSLWGAAAVPGNGNAIALSDQTREALNTGEQMVFAFAPCGTGLFTHVAVVVAVDSMGIAESKSLFPEPSIGHNRSQTRPKGSAVFNTKFLLKNVRRVRVDKKELLKMVKLLQFHQGVQQGNEVVTSEVRALEIAQNDKLSGARPLKGEMAPVLRLLGFDA